MCAPASPPPAPNYVQAAKEQGVQNIDAARTQGQINNPNVVSPYGTQTVSFGGMNQPGYDAAMADWNAAQAQARTLSQQNSGATTPMAGDQLAAYNQAMQRAAAPMPTQASFTTPQTDQPTITQKFSPEQQALYEQSTATQQQLGRVAGQGATALEGVVGKPVDFAGAPQTGDYSATRQKVIDAYMSRANEDYSKQSDQSNSDLVARGIPMGSKAYGDQQQMIERSRNDARQQAEVAGGNAASQAYGMDSDRRRQAITEMLAQRQTPINEISALMSGSQVSNPFSTPGYAQNTQVAPPPTYAATNALGQYGTDVYNAQMGAQGNLQSGLFGLGGAGLMAGAMFASDRRVKRNVTRIGTHPLGIGLYRFRYKSRYQRQWGHGWKVGVMAQEVLTVRPEAVVRHPDGYLMVDYRRL